MTAYQWCELALASDLELPELRPAVGQAGAQADWRIRVVRGSAPSQRGRHWFHHWRFPDGRRWLMFAKHARGYLLRFPGMADFNVLGGVREITCYRAPGTPLRTLRHLLLDQVLPLSAGSRRRLALHASVVLAGPGAVAFLGAAGHGKSTLAARLAQRGHPLISDDCCLLVRTDDGFDVAPSYPGVRLSPESISEVFSGLTARLQRVSHYSRKRRIAPADAGVRFCNRVVPLRRLYVLAPLADLQRATAVVIRSGRPRERLMDLLGFTFHLDVRDAGRIRDAFELAGDVVSRYDVRQLTFPWNLADTGMVADAVLDDLTR